MVEDRRWTVVTGASSGIGAELARVFAARGSSLVLVARRRERMEALAADLRDRDIAIEIMALDLQDPAAPAALVRALDSLGIVTHTLVNNAGFGLRGPFADLSYDEQVGMVELNVMAVTKLCRMALPGMIERRGGGILNVASTAAFQAGPNMAVYYATKAFVLSLSEALHEEAKPHGVTVTALCPGPVPTEFQVRADMDTARLMKLNFMALSATEVARAGVDGYEAGKAIVIPGFVNRFSAWGAQHLAPRFLTRKLAGKLQA